jgi:hypothetical protein
LPRDRTRMPSSAQYTPGRARTCPGARQNDVAPRHARPPFESSSRQQLHYVTLYTLDTLTCSRDRCRRRHHRRCPPQYCKLPSSSRAHHGLVFTAVKPCVTSLTPPTRTRHRQCPCALVAPSP